MHSEVCFKVYATDVLCFVWECINAVLNKLNVLHSYSAFQKQTDEGF